MLLLMNIVELVCVPSISENRVAWTETDSVDTVLKAADIMKINQW